MTENESINGWTFEETVKIAENLMEAESNMFKWDVLRHLRNFLENYKDELEQYRAIGTIEEFKALKEKNVAKKPIGEYTQCKCSVCGRRVRSGRGSSSFVRDNFCQRCGQKLDW